MLTHEENRRLCEVGPDTPMGTMFRRYWFPVLVSGEVAEPGGAPRRIKLLGEDLVVFRDTEGRLGILDANCPHRGASLGLARNEDCGLRCLYHGWLVDRNGNVLDTPNEPERSRFKEHVKHVAYSAAELGGLVWAYMGPADYRPPLPRFEWTSMDPSHVSIVTMRIACNWAQIVEGLIDSSHSNFLHRDRTGADPATAKPGGGSQLRIDEGSGRYFMGRPSRDTRPHIEVQDTDYGFRYAAIRRPLVDAEHFKYVRTTLFAAPVYAIIPARHGWGEMQFPVPIDDHTSMFYNIQYCYGEPVDDERLRERAGARIGVDIDENSQKTGTVANNWLQDRGAMMAGSWSGIHGVMNEDAAVQESMGPIIDRTREHLGAADRAVIHMRRIMLDSARRVGTGGSPLGLDSREIPYHLLRAEDRVCRIEEPWQAVGAFAGEQVPSR